MKKRALALFIVMLFVLPITSSFVTNPGGSNLQNETKSVLSYEEEQIKHLACGGSVDTDLYIDGDYWDTWVDDASYLSAYPINYTGIHLVFNITERLPLTEISFFLRWQVSTSGPGDVYWMIYNFDTSSYDTIYYAVLSNPMSWEDRKESITFNENYMNSTNHVRFYAYGSNLYVDEIEVDYAYLTVIKGYDGEFRETLPDDLRYSPDSVSRSSFATGGESGYENTYAVDGVFFISPPPIEFECQDFYEIEYFEYAVYGNSTGASNMYYYDGVESQEVFDQIDEPTLEWFNGTETDVSPLSNIASTGIFYVVISSVTTTTWIDYIEITFYYTIGLSENTYAESFFSVSDWTDDNATITTDGDVGTITENGAGTSGFVYWDFGSPTDISGLYFEIAIVAINGGGDWKLRVLDIDVSGTDLVSWTSTDGLFKGVIQTNDATTACDRIRIQVRDDSDSVEIDYLRIGPSTEMGWQHDGSTISGVTDDDDGDKTYTYSSDGSTLNMTVSSADSATTAYMYLKPDMTSTICELNLDYYPMLEVRFRFVTETVDVATLAFRTGGYRTVVVTNTETDLKDGNWHTVRKNVLAGSATEDNYGLYAYALFSSGEQTLSVDIDYVKVYSIANYTVTQSSTTIDDVLYEEVGVLHSEMDDGYFILEYDPLFNFTGSYTWTKTTTSGESYLSFLHGEWTDYTNETIGTLYAGSTTGLRIKFDETANIQTIEFSVRQAQWVLIGTAIIYFDMPNWWLIGVAGAVFYIPIGEFTLQLLMMILGLVMIPFSTLYLVMGGKDDMDRDKLYFFLLMFLIGWALVLGGLM